MKQVFAFLLYVYFMERSVLVRDWKYSCLPMLLISMFYYTFLSFVSVFLLILAASL